MKSSALLLLSFIFAVAAHTQTSWLDDDFHRDSLGGTWQIASGQWKIVNTALQNRSTTYDDLIASTLYTFAQQSFSIRTELRGLRAGLFFCLDSRSSKALSQMVRFDEKSILTGYFNAAGEFTATNTFDSPVIPTNWTELRIDVDPTHRSISIFVNGAFCGKDTSLQFSSGWLGLEASDGLCEFRAVSVTSSKPRELPSPPQVGSMVSLSHLSFVASRGNLIELYHPEFQRTMTVDSSGTLVSSQIRDDQPAMPRRVLLRNRTFSISGTQIVIRDRDGAIVDSLSDHLVAPASLAANHDAVYVSDPGALAIFKFSADGTLLQTIDGSTVGGFKAPKGLAVNGSGALIVADFDRIIFLDEHALGTPVASPHTGGTSCTITWNAYSGSHPWLDLAPDGGPWQRYTNITSDPSGTYTITLTELKPLTRYSFRLSPMVRILPESEGTSKTFRFATSPANVSQMSMTRLPVLCMVYRTISFRDRYPKSVYPNVPDGRTLSAGDLEYLQRATAFNREFYFRNSGCKVVLDFDFYVVEDTLWLHEVGDTDPYWLSPNERVTRDFESAARTFGKKPTDYCGLICPYAWVNYPPRRTSALRDPSRKDSITIRQAVGGGTYGVPAPWKYGTTAGFTSNPFQDRFSRQDWLITHEFHHQIDALMDISGYPEYYHADQPWKMPGRFGEDFDFNAKIIRNAGRGWWLNLRFGTLYETTDEDHDGVPDNDPSLPFDEIRLGSNPHLSDTDGDGVSDLDEVMMGSTRSSSLTEKDTDRDGLQDNVDPEPLYPIDPTIQRLNAGGRLDDHPFGIIHTPGFDARLFLAWTDTALILGLESATPVNLLAQLDANNDGWFHGFDNYQLRILCTNDSASVADFYLRDCSSWTNSPKDRRDILQPSHLGITYEPTNTQENDARRRRLVVRIPSDQRHGLSLKPGKKLSVRFGVQSQTDLWVWDELFERNYMMQVELQ